MPARHYICARRGHGWRNWRIDRRCSHHAWRNCSVEKIAMARKRNPDLTQEQKRVLARIDRLNEEAQAIEEELGIVDAEIEDAIEEIKGTERELRRLDRFVKGKQSQADKLRGQIKDIDREVAQIAKQAGVTAWL